MSITACEGIVLVERLVQCPPGMRYSASCPAHHQLILDHHRFRPITLDGAAVLPLCLSDRDVEELLFARGMIVTDGHPEVVPQVRVKPMRMSSGIDGPGIATRGTWTRCFWPSMADAITCGGPWIRTITSSICW